MNEEKLSRTSFGIMFTWKENKGRTSKLVDEGSNNWNEREIEINIMEWIYGEEWRKNKIKTLGTKRYENIVTL